MSYQSKQKTQKRSRLIHRKLTKKRPGNKIINKQIIGGGFKDFVIRNILRRGSYELPKAQHEPIEEQKNAYENYLSCVDIKSSSPGTTVDLKPLIMKSTFKDVGEFANILNKIASAIPNYPEQQSTSDKWVECIKECQTTLNEAISKELNSTAYMLRVLSMSLVNDRSVPVPEDQKNNPCYNSFGGKIRFEIAAGFNFFTGIWKRDRKYINMIVEQTPSPSQSPQPLKQTTGRLIMGFGPSASGKTHCAAQVIKLMRSVEPDFPSVFLAIDGGTYREKSVMYQTIIKAIQAKNQYTGLSNLVAPGITGTTLFGSDIVKQAMVEYLKQYTGLANGKQLVKPINLYVPETLGKCESVVGIAPCAEKYNKYIELTGDTQGWIGLMIYQHITRNECNYKPEYKCVGTTQSGENRAQEEGKKYSSGAWEISYKNGNAQIEKAPGYRFRIHNGGAREKPSIFEDLSTPDKQLLSQEALLEASTETSTDNTTNQYKILDFLKSINWIYIPGKVKNNAACRDYINEDAVAEICNIKQVEQSRWGTFRRRMKSIRRTSTMANNPSIIRSVVNKALPTSQTEINSGPKVNIENINNSSNA